MPRTALVVDDEPQIRALLAAYLERDGFVVRQAGTGAEALRQAGLEPVPDVVLLDIGLPDLDGVEVLRLLRRERDLPVVMVSARTEEGDVLVGLATGLVLYVGAQRVLAGALTPGELVVFLTYLKTAFKPLRDVAKYTGRIAKAAASGERIVDVLAD